jgi:type VI secretion system protein ImpG
VSDALLDYYQRELAFIRQLGTEFAHQHSKIAGRIRLGPDRIDDPLVGRLVESCALMNARIRQKLDDDFPEIAEAMLGVLYPHYLAPIPSMAIVEFVPDPEQGKQTVAQTIEPGTMVETDPQLEMLEGEPCRFRTCYPTELLPLSIGHAGLHPRPFPAPAGERSSEASWVLHLRLECLDVDPKPKVSELGLDTIRLFLLGKNQYVFELYEALFLNVVEVVVASSSGSRLASSLGPDCLRQVGFDLSEGMLPYPARSFQGYRLLTEFFAFPSKFLFCDITGLQGKIPAGAESTLDLYVFFDKLPPRLEPSYVTKDSFRLNCTPIVNLYEKRAEPIRLTHTEAEVLVIPDARRPHTHEVYSIDRVTATSPEGVATEYRPFYSARPLGHRATQTYWHSARRPAGSHDEHLDTGTDVFLTLVDLNFQPAEPARATLHIKTTCLNRDLPARLPFGGSPNGGNESELQPRLQAEQAIPVKSIRCLTPPTPTLRPALGQAVLWPLISHLTLNHLSISEGRDGAEALRSILQLYDFTDSEDTQAMIDGVVGVSCRGVVGRADESSGETGFARGLEVTVRFNEDRFAGNSVFLLASVLERFFGLYVSINSFTRLVAVVSTGNRARVLKRWACRAGEKTLL